MNIRTQTGLYIIIYLLATFIMHLLPATPRIAYILPPGMFMVWMIVASTSHAPSLSGTVKFYQITTRWTPPIVAATIAALGVFVYLYQCCAVSAYIFICTYFFIIAIKLFFLYMDLVPLYSKPIL